MRGFVPTPAAVVDLMCDKLFGPMPPGPSSSLLDPGCGTGAFLEGVIRWCKRHASAVPRCTGIELNPALVHVVRKRLDPAHPVTILHADFLGRAHGRYDYVIANPPYVNIGLLSEAEKARLRRRFETARGRFDLYLLFFEQALRSLAPGGRLVFITPEKFAYVATALPLRRLLSQMKVEEVQLVQETTFGDLITYPAITSVVNEAPGRSTRIVHRDGTVRNVELPAHGGSWLPAMNGRTAPPARWSLASICDRVSCGVATGADSVFVLREDRLPVELRPFAHPTIAGRELTEGVPIGNRIRHFMVVPYRPDGRLLPEAELGPLADFLRTPARRTQLLGRTCVARKPWYAFHENPLLSAILRPKLLCKDIGSHPVFFLDERGDLVPRHSVYYIIPKNSAQLYDLAHYLNSPEVRAWLNDHCQRAANGFVRLQSTVLKLLPIPERFVSSTEKAVRARRSGPRRDSGGAGR